ncbi:hypothetical protein ABIQ69_11515 [Agromyces sp. G08B096]|uniref:Head-to-tail stopper n=1 Tax=Agromyces sp. G08B096 TaxID=3156399 RepID=A0AAU7W4Y6_9MICO
MSDLDDFFVHTVTVEAFQDTNGYGEPQYAAPAVVACFTEAKRRLVRSSTGEEVVSETTLYTDASHETKFPPGSRVTVGADVATVITAGAFTSGDLDLPDHLVVNLDRGASRNQ